MQELAIFLAGIIVGVGLAAVIAFDRRTPVDGGPSVAPGLAASTTPTSASRDAASDLMDALATQAKGSHLTKRIVTHRYETLVEPSGLTIKLDGQTYHHLQDVPDPTIREQIQRTLSCLPAQITDPSTRLKL
jgi:hypothetical protein